MIQKSILLFLALVLLASGRVLFAADSDFGHWEDYGLKAKLNAAWNIKSDIQFRWRNNASDLNYFRWEFGPGVKVGKYFDLLVMYRYNPVESNNKWSTQHFLMIDPDFMLYSSATWNFDFLARVKVRLGGLGKGYYRPRVQVARKFKIKETKASWFTNNEFFLQNTALKGWERFNQNRFTTGLKLSLNKTIDLSAYYMLRTDKPAGKDYWNKVHILGTVLYFNF